MKLNVDDVIQKEVSGDCVVSIDEALIKGLNDEVFSTGIKEIDDVFTDEGQGGFRSGDLVVISGKSGNGKTLFAQNLIRNFLKAGVPSLFFSYEVIINRVYKTFLKMGVDAKPAIYTPKKNVTGDINWIKEKIKEADAKNFMTKVIVIDHLDFITAKDIKTSDVRRNEINNIVTELKNFAVEQRKIIILLAHVVKTKESSLENEDIADSRAINNLADTIIFIGRAKDEKGLFIGNKGVAKVSKNRLTGQQLLYKFEVTDNKLIVKDNEPDTNIR